MTINKLSCGGQDPNSPRIRQQVYWSACLEHSERSKSLMNHHLWITSEPFRTKSQVLSGDKPLIFTYWKIHSFSSKVLNLLIMQICSRWNDSHCEQRLGALNTKIDHIHRVLECSDTVTEPVTEAVTDTATDTQRLSVAWTLNHVIIWRRLHACFSPKVSIGLARN